MQSSFPSVSAKGKGQSAASWVEVAKKGRQVIDKRKPSSWRLDAASGAILSGSQARQRIQDDVAINAQWIYVPDAREAHRLLDFARVHDCKAKVGVVFQGPVEKLTCDQKQFPSLNESGQSVS